jgi:hypothetical protein
VERKRGNQVKDAVGFWCGHSQIFYVAISVTRLRR